MFPALSNLWPSGSAATQHLLTQRYIDKFVPMCGTDWPVLMMWLGSPWLPEQDSFRALQPGYSEAVGEKSFYSNCCQDTKRDERCVCLAPFSFFLSFLFSEHFHDAVHLSASFLFFFTFSFLFKLLLWGTIFFWLDKKKKQKNPTRCKITILSHYAGLSVALLFRNGSRPHVSLLSLFILMYFNSAWCLCYSRHVTTGVVIMRW